MFNNKQAASKNNRECASPQDNADNDFKKYLSKAGFKNSEIDAEFAKNSSYLHGVYYLHSDHLGTATYVTNEIAKPTSFS